MYKYVYIYMYIYIYLFIHIFGLHSLSPTRMNGHAPTHSHVQPIQLGVAFVNAVSKLKAQSLNVSFH